MSLTLSFLNKGAEPGDSWKSSSIPPPSLSPRRHPVRCQVQLMSPPRYLPDLSPPLCLPPLRLSCCRLGLGHCGSSQPGQAASALACFQISSSYYFQSHLSEMESKYIRALVGTTGLPVIALWRKTNSFTMAFKGLQSLGPAYFSS